MVWAKLRTETFSSNSSSKISGFVEVRKFVQCIIHGLVTGGDGFTRWRLNNDTGSNYSDRISSNGGAESTATSASSLRCIDQGSNCDFFVISYLTNISNGEKICISFGVDIGASGAGTAPSRNEMCGKWTNVSTQSSSLDYYDSASIGADAYSNLTTLGTD